jgi:cystathionine beta-synthase
MNDPKSALPPVVGSALDLIGNTPMVEVRNLDTGPCRLFLKLENQNPGGSIKDRVARSMIEAAEADGSLKPGGTIIEATAGNTGLGLAQVATLKGYKLILIVPDKMAREKILHLRAMGVDVRLTRSDVGKGHPEYYQDMAQTLAQSIPGAIYVNQFENPANPLAHETTTAPGDLRADGRRHRRGGGRRRLGRHPDRLGRFMARHSPKTKMVLADPVGSILCDYVATGTYRRGRLVDRRGHRRGLHPGQRPDGLRQARPIRSATARASTPPACCCARRASWPARPRAPCWRRPCAIAASRPSPSGW